MFKSHNGVTIGLRDIGGLLRVEIKAHHHRGTAAHLHARTGIDGPLQERKTLLPQMYNSRFHLNGVTQKYRRNKVGIDVGNYRHHLLRTEVGAEHMLQVVLLAQVVKGKVGIVVDMTVTVDIIKAYLNGNTPMEHRRTVGLI